MSYKSVQLVQEGLKLPQCYWTHVQLQSLMYNPKDLRVLPLWPKTRSDLFAPVFVITTFVDYPRQYPDRYVFPNYLTFGLIQHFLYYNLSSITNHQEIA